MPILRLVLRSLVWLVLAVGLGTLVAVVLVPRIMGWVPLTVLSGSMEPTFPAGSQVVVEPVEGMTDANSLEVGAVVTFMPRPDDSTLVTHRIVDKVWRQDGAAVFTTRGDANNITDEWELTYKQIRGEVRYHVPYVGHVANALDQDEKNLGIIAAATGLFGYAGWQFLQALRRTKNVESSRGSHRADALAREK